MNRALLSSRLPALALAAGYLAAAAPRGGPGGTPPTTGPEPAGGAAESEQHDVRWI